jgi:hypothetical protein
MTNRIVIPANFTFEVIIKVDPVNGQSELLIRNRSKVQISMWQVAGLLAEHTSVVMKSLLAGKVKQEPAIIEEPVGDNNAS